MTPSIHFLYLLLPAPGAMEMYHIYIYIAKEVKVGLFSFLGSSTNSTDNRHILVGNIGRMDFEYGQIWEFFFNERKFTHWAKLTVSCRQKKINYSFFLLINASPKQAFNRII